MKKKGYRSGGKVKKMMKGGAAGGKKPRRMMKGGTAGGKKPMMMKKGGRAGGAKKMTVAQLRAAAKKMGFKVTKDTSKKKKYCLIYIAIYPILKHGFAVNTLITMKSITANFYMLWLLALHQCQTGVLAFKLSSLVVKLKVKRRTQYTVEQCGLECL